MVPRLAPLALPLPIISINSLPPEVLSMIFDFATAASDPRQDYCSRLASFRDLSTLQSILHVCCKWHGVCRDFNKFWTSVSVEENAESFIAASGKMPLSLFSPKTASEGVLLRLLASNSARIKDLDVALTAARGLADIMAHAFPILESLRTSFSSSWFDVTGPRALQLSSVGSSHFPGLTHLSLGSLRHTLSLTISDLCLMLANMPNLEFLHISLPECYELPPSPSSPSPSSSPSAPNPSPDPPNGDSSNPESSPARPLSRLRTLSLSNICPESAVALYRALDPSPTVAIRLASVSLSEPPPDLDDLIPAPFCLDGFTDLTWALTHTPTFTPTHNRVWIAADGGARGALQLTGEWAEDDEDPWLPWIEDPHAWLPAQTLRRLTLTTDLWYDLAEVLDCTPALVALTVVRHPVGLSRLCGVVPAVCDALALGRAERCPLLAELVICAGDLAVDLSASVERVLAMARARERAGRRLARLALDADGPCSHAIWGAYWPVGAHVGVLEFDEKGLGGAARLWPALERWRAVDEGGPWTVGKDQYAVETSFFPWAMEDVPPWTIVRDEYAVERSFYPWYDAVQPSTR